MDSTVLKVELDTTQASASIDALTAKVEALQAKVDALNAGLAGMSATLKMGDYRKMRTE